jgi:outer membrane translocation and assembly module TamA
MMPVGARGGVVRESRFRQDTFRASAQVSYHPIRALTIGFSGALVYRKFFPAEGDDFEDREGPQIAEVFDLATVNRFVEGSKTAYGELEVTYDARKTPSRFESLATPSAGWYLQGFAGYTGGIGGDPSSYIRYGLDLQRYLRLGEGPRSLALRAKIEGVTGGYKEVSFYDLPKLGGPLLLRGYFLDQYRDRVAVMSSIEYQFDTSENSGGFLFADVGRVYSQPEDLSFADMRLGFGGGIQFHSKKSFLGRLTIASSPQKNVFLSLSFDPIYDTRARVERR